jgi:hypothetical protein
MCHARSRKSNLLQQELCFLFPACKHFQIKFNRNVASSEDIYCLTKLMQRINLHIKSKVLTILTAANSISQEFLKITPS